MPIKKGQKGKRHPAWKGGLPINKKYPNYFKVYEENKRLSILKKRESLVGRKRPKTCEICGSIGRICFDHDHKKGIFRGWICVRCNVALGMVKDNSELLIRLADYLNNFRNKHGN